MGAPLPATAGIVGNGAATRLLQLIRAKPGTQGPICVPSIIAVETKRPLTQDHMTRKGWGRYLSPKSQKSKAIHLSHCITSHELLGKTLNLSENAPTPPPPP